MLGEVAGHAAGARPREGARARSICWCAAAAEALLASAHDCGDGGAGASPSPSARSGRATGSRSSIPTDLPPHVALFSESASRAVVSVAPRRRGRVPCARPPTHGVPDRADRRDRRSAGRDRRGASTSRSRSSPRSGRRRSRGCSARPCDAVPRARHLRLLADARGRAPRRDARDADRALGCDAGRGRPAADRDRARRRRSPRTGRSSRTGGGRTPGHWGAGRTPSRFVGERLELAMTEDLRARLVENFRIVGETAAAAPGARVSRNACERCKARGRAPRDRVRRRAHRLADPPHAPRGVRAPAVLRRVVLQRRDRVVQARGRRRSAGAGRTRACRRAMPPTWATTNAPMWPAPRRSGWSRCSTRGSRTLAAWLPEQQPGTLADHVVDDLAALPGGPGLLGISHDRRRPRVVPVWLHQRSWGHAHRRRSRTSSPRTAPP